jgi:GT2 family glycosyltransferase
MCVSVVVPTYRRPRQLQACLEALATQDIQENWEVVVVDDGSPEPPLPAVESLVAAHGWQLIRQANAGPSAARNRGVREARGEFVAFTDDDCLPEPAWLAKLLREAWVRPHALVGGTTVNGLTADLFASTSQLIVDFVYEHFNADLKNGYFLASNNLLCSIALFQEVGGFDESFTRAGAEDRDFCDRWRMRGWPITWQPEARIEHRHRQSFSNFIKLHIRYGRGAYNYQKIRKERGSGSMRKDFGFHKTLPRRVWNYLKRPGQSRVKIATVGALSVWQIANATGFLLEALMVSTGKTGERSQPTS